MRGKGKEGRRLQAAPRKGTPNKEEGSKQRSSSAVLRLEGKEGGDI
jgi:hypothetical protein